MATISVIAAKATSCNEMKEKEILRQRINVGYVFQNFNLFHAPDGAGEPD